ncbi:MAG: hypothetical protein GXP56_15320 [Deltaproteobacteria bacterium]|nr:hypothetical protein [Deltaproteobacteria bacterium]
MGIIKKIRCRNCNRLFVPDSRNKGRQKYCDKTECRKASKTVSQKKWLSKPENKDYFRGPENVERVREWRKKNPGYWKQSKKPIALQDPLMAQHTEKIKDNSQVANCTLQDLLRVQPPVIIGLIANFIGSALQDDIALTLLRMQQSGQDILCLQPQTKGGECDYKIPDFKTADPQGSPKLQLG